MRRSVTDGCFWAGMMGFGDQFLPAFILAMKLGEGNAVLVSTLPGFFGAALTLLTPWAVDRLGSHKKWVVLSAGLQALMFVPLVIAAIVGAMPVWAAFAVIALYQFGGLAAGVAWSTWMSTVVPADRRAGFFSFRNRMIWTTQLVAIFAAGFVLDQFKVAPGVDGAGAAGDVTANRVLIGFVLIFSVACVCRGVSTGLLARIGEPVPLPNGHRVVPFTEVARHIRTSAESKLILAMLLIALSTNVSLGALSPFVLGSLNQPESMWAWVMGAMMVGRIAVLFRLGKVIDRVGPKAVMLIAAGGIALVHGLFLLTRPAADLLAPLAAHMPGALHARPELLYVMGVQVIAGVLYAAYDLSTWLLLLRHTRDDERTSLITLTWFGFWAFSTAGTFVGYAILEPFKLDAAGAKRFSYEGYMYVFAIGTALRLVTFAIMWWWTRKLPKH